MTETRSVRPPESLVLREYTTYDEAQRMVDGLSDAGFPVERVRIIGHDMYSVEQVTGRLTKGRAALLGVGGGACLPGKGEASAAEDRAGEGDLGDAY